MATELAKAYVQIIPSAQGIQGKIGQALGNDPDNAGRSAGAKLGSSLVSQFKSVMVTLGVGKILQEAFSEGADMQQSLGGVETLFKENADQVKKYAAEAYKTAGMSANEYMETVTSFSASLLQSLGGDTEQAAEVANMALTDMSDNANKMGTSMELIQNAYQGFAKQNYTMLDNLKLGYGGTKSEMERLLADAKKLSGVDYSIDNLNDVYEAIHVIQGEMEISGRSAEEVAEIFKNTGREVKEQLGTTAMEGAITFSGSLASMKAAASNFLAGLTLGQDIVPLLENLGSTILTFVQGNLLPMAMNVVKSIPDIAKTILQFAMDAISQYAAEPSQMIQSAVTMVTNFANGILENIPVFITAIGSMWTQFVTYWMENLPLIWQAGVDLVLNLVNGIIENLPSIVDSAVKVIANFLETVLTKLPEILESGISIIAELAAGLIQAIPKVVEKIPEIFQSIKNAFAEKDWLSIGKDIIEGIKNGIVNGISKIVEAAKNVAQNALDAAREALGINSPSKEFLKIGASVDEGFSMGIKKNSAMVSKALDTLAKETVNGFSSKVAPINGTVDIRSNKDSSSNERMDMILALLYHYLPECAKQIVVDGESIVNSLNRELGMAVM